MTFTEVTIWTPSYPETFIQIFEDGSIGDIYRYKGDCEDDSNNWTGVGLNPLFKHYSGKSKSKFRQLAIAQLKRDIAEDADLKESTKSFKLD